MPLYMDFHKFDSITIKDVKSAHMADVDLQEKYGVRYIQFWVNEQAGTVFCLTEGPNKEACETVHRLAHGNIACALVEVETGFYETVMGKPSLVDKEGLVRFEDGGVDLGYRTIVVISLRLHAMSESSKDLNRLRPSDKMISEITKRISEHNGRRVKWETDESIIGVFSDCTAAIHCALEIQSELTLMSQEQPYMTFVIGLSAGQPVTHDGQFFTHVIHDASCFSKVAQDHQIVMSSLVKDLCNDEHMLRQRSPALKMLTEPECIFISRLFSVVEARLGDESFTIDMLCDKLALSRPMLYRKITTLTGRAPNDLIRDMRIEKAFSLLKRMKGNISEIALEVGINSPSYFSKCFAAKYGCKPSEFLSLAAV